MATAKKIQSDISSLKIAIRVAKNDAIKKKLKSRLEMAENELASIKSGAKPRKVSTTKGTKSLLEKAKALVKKNPKFAQYKGSGVDLEKDAKEGALPIGRRISKGLKANQVSGKGNAKQNKGNVYYEYRVNRLDVKQPKGKQSYPKLEDGGYMAKGGIIYLESVGTYFRPSDMTTSPDKKFENEGEITYVFENSDEWWDALSTNDREKIKKYEKREMGGYMAKGGIYSSDSLYILTVSKDGKEVAKERFRAKSMKEARMMGEDMEDEYKSQFGGDLSFSISEAMADGGMMADGGYVAVAEKDGYWTIMSKPTSKEKAQKQIDLGVPRGEVGKVVTLEEAKAHKKVIGREYLADGVMMAKGGKLDVGVYRVGKPTKVSPMLYEQKIVEIFKNGDISTASDYGRKLSDFNLQKYPIISKEQLDAQYKMAYGGYMAKGGEIIPYIIWVSKDGEKREFYGEYKSQRAAEMAMKKLWDSSDYKAMGNKPKKMYEKDGFYKYGGYMADGGMAEGYHQMPDGSIMANSAHMAKGGTISGEFKQARYAKGKIAYHPPKSEDKYKNREMRLAEAKGVNGKWSHREKAYIMSKGQAEKLKKYLLEGKDASSITGNIYERDEMAYGGMMAKGGKIKNQYENKSAEDVWSSWSVDQRSHFLLDHSELLDKDRMENNLGYSRSIQKNKKYSDLTPFTKRVLESHVNSGQYADGGMMAKGGIVAHGLEVGDKIVYTDGDNVYVKNGTDEYKVNLNSGKREFQKFSREANGGYMAHGGETHRAEDPEEVEIDEDEMKVIRGYSDDEAYEYAKGGMTLKAGDIVEATTGVKLKVMDFKPDFGGRALVQRIDEFGEGLKPAWMPLTKFKLPKLI